MTERSHKCNELCVCPVHGTALIYWPAGDDHACSIISCIFAHGMRDKGEDLMPGPGEELYEEFYEKMIRLKAEASMKQQPIIRTGDTEIKYTGPDSKLIKMKIIELLLAETGLDPEEDNFIYFCDKVYNWIMDKGPMIPQQPGEKLE